MLESHKEGVLTGGGCKQLQACMLLASRTSQSPGVGRMQVIKESLRMFPVAATGLSRCCDEDTQLGGYLLPAGTEVQARAHTPCLQAATVARACFLLHQELKGETRPIWLIEHCMHKEGMHKEGDCGCRSPSTRCTC